ncbi:MAG: Uma2 family endonuclease [Acidobacteriaceae bacterium]
MSTLLPLDTGMLPRSLVLDPPMSDSEFEAMCRANDSIHFERTREGVIRMNPPAGGFTGDGNSSINQQLRNWWETKAIGRVFDSSTGFRLPDTSTFSPDAAYISADRLSTLAKQDLRGFPHVCPDFVIELLSASDLLAEAQFKMARWIENGALLGWLIDPYEKQVWVYRPGHEASRVSCASIDGSGPVAGFTLNLDKIWRCYEF